MNDLTSCTWRGCVVGMESNVLTEKEAVEMRGKLGESVPICGRGLGVLNPVLRR